MEYTRACTGNTNTAATKPVAWRASLPSVIPGRMGRTVKTSPTLLNPKHHGHQCDGRSELGNRQDTASTTSITRQPHPGSVPFDMDRMPGCPPDTLPASMWRRHTPTAIRWDRSRPTTIHPVQTGYTGDRQQAIREEPNHTYISSRKGWPGPFRKFGFVANFYIKRLPRILEPMNLHGRRSASTRAPLRQRSMHAPEPAPGLGPDRKP